MVNPINDITGKDLMPLLQAAEWTARLKQGVLTEEDAKAFEAWLAQRPEHQHWFNQLQDTHYFRDQITANNWDTETDKALAHFQSIRSSSPVIARRITYLRRWWAAASILLLLGLGTFLWYQNTNQPQTPTNTYNQSPKDIEPGREGAILTLADGTQVVLDSLGNGVIAIQSGTQVMLKDGQLAYDPTGEKGADVMYNTMSTPKGRQFQLLLPDGTKVWLNAASSIRYPIVFTGKERKVEVTGEAYFEVAKHLKMPFRAIVNKKAEVEVLGTHFNINAYEDKRTINTTLLEGSIRVSLVSSNQPEYAKNVMLKPGQQAVVQVGQNTKIINAADIENVMAWKNGAFNLQDASLQEVMRELERWYDIEVVYEKGIPDIQFVGKMSRDVSLAELIKGLESLEIHFRIEEGRKLIVLP